MTTLFKKLYKLAGTAESTSNGEQYMPLPFGDDPEHGSTMDPANMNQIGITEPKEDGNQFTGSKKTADRSNTDESGSPGAVGAPKHVYDINVTDDPTQQMFGDAGETSRGDNSIIMANVKSDLEARKLVYAYIIENGTPQCSVCHVYYTPKTIAEAKLAHCGNCPEDKVEEGDIVDGDVVKTSSKVATEKPSSCPGCGEKTSKTWVNGTCNTCGYKSDSSANKFVIGSHLASTKISNDSELYTRGFLDHLHGKPLDEDLAVLSDDYFNGYDQARFYGKTPLESVGTRPHHVVIPEHIDTSLEGWGQSGIGGQDYHYDVERSQVIASTLPTNVLEAFFNTEE